MDKRTKIVYIDRPNRITMDNGDYAVSNYLPDGTLTRRTFCSKRIETVTKVNADGDTIVRNVTRTTSNIHDYMGSFWTVRGSGTAKRVLTPTGYVDLTTGKRYWYLTNRQGSTMAVVDETGAVVQRNGYYPSGTPFVLPSEIGEDPAPSMTAVTDQLHIGNRWLSHSGLNMYDNTARLHDPLLMRFTAPDPLADKYPDFSPWSHCAANPANAVDLFGEEPTELEAARMCAYTCGNTNVDLIGDWNVSSKKIDKLILNHERSGFKSQLFERTVNGTTEYAYSLAGTDGFDYKDWQNNAQQVFGQSAQYEIAMNNAAKIVQDINGSELTFVGYSLGGGMAAACAYSLGGRAITFNPAGVSWFTQMPNPKARIDVYITYRDELNFFQSTTILPGPDGNIHYRLGDASLLGHDINNFYEPSAYEKAYNYVKDKVINGIKAIENFFTPQNLLPF